MCVWWLPIFFSTSVFNSVCVQTCTDNVHVCTCLTVCVAMYFPSLLTFRFGGLGVAFSVDAVTAAPSAGPAGSLGAWGGGSYGGGPVVRGDRSAVILLLTPRLLVNSRGGGLDLFPLYVSLSPPLPAPPSFSPSSSRRGQRAAVLARGSSRGHG